MKIRGSPPPRLTGGRRVRSLTSLWWDQTVSEMVLIPDLVGKTLSIEEITQMVPSYPDGRRPRPRAVARRMTRILELVSRGPNGSRGRGAMYRIIDLPAPVQSPDRDDVDDVVIHSDEKWLAEQIERMTRK